jgi:hypothetical protein
MEIRLMQEYTAVFLACCRTAVCEGAIIHCGTDNGRISSDDACPSRWPALKVVIKVPIAVCY